MRAKIFFIILLLLCLVLNSQEFKVKKVEIEKQYNQMFKNHKWIGGDGAHSIKIGKNKILWTFGDTILGKVEDNKRKDYSLINNSLGIQTNIDSSKAEMEFYWRKDNDKNIPYFPTKENNTWYWPYQPVIVKNTLYIFSKKYAKTDENSLGFKEIGGTIFEIKNYEETPDKWEVKYIKNILNFGCYAIHGKNYIYIFDTELVKKPVVNRYLLMARVSKNSVPDFTKWEFYAGESYVSDIEKAKPIFNQVGSELSIHYNKKLKKYFAVYTHLGLSENIMLRYSNSLEDSWSPQQSIYKCPEPSWKKEYFSYAAKAHPELTNYRNKLIITYAVNSFDFWDLFKDARIYFPKFIEVEFDLK